MFSVQPGWATVKYHQWGEYGHIRSGCPKNPHVTKDGESAKQLQKVGFCVGDKSVPNFSVSGTIIGSWTSNIIWDTGCFCVVVSEDVLPD